MMMGDMTRQWGGGIQHEEGGIWQQQQQWEGGGGGILHEGGIPLASQPPYPLIQRIILLILISPGTIAGLSFFGWWGIPGVDWWYGSHKSWVLIYQGAIYRWVFPQSSFHFLKKVIFRNDLYKDNCALWSVLDSDITLQACVIFIGHIAFWCGLPKHDKSDPPCACWLKQRWKTAICFIACPLPFDVRCHTWHPYGIWSGLVCMDMAAFDDTTFLDMDMLVISG